MEIKTILHSGAVLHKHIYDIHETCFDHEDGAENYDHLKIDSTLVTTWSFEAKKLSF